MARGKGRKKMTLSEHIALRAKQAEEFKAREEERQRTIDTFKKLDARALCNCPACVRRRSLHPKS